MEKDKFVDIKIREIYRNMLKKYSTKHGYKMYALVEQLIERECSENGLLKTKN